MTTNDFWQHRYEAVVTTRLTGEEAAAILDLMTEDPERFQEALRTFVTESDIVVCECSEADCLAGPHGTDHWARATWQAIHIEDSEDDYVHLCTPCKVSREQRPDGTRFRYEEMEDEEEVAGDA